MLTVEEEERHKWRPKHQMQQLQQQQKHQNAKGKFLSQDMNIYPITLHSVPSTNFISDQQKRPISPINSKEKIFSSLDLNQSSKCNDNSYSNVPTSVSDLGKEPKCSYNLIKNDTSVADNYGHRREEENKKGTRISNNNINQESSSINSVSTITAATWNMKSNNTCNNLSSHNPSKFTHSLKPQKSFTNQSPKMIRIDDNTNAKYDSVEAQHSREMGRFSPTPTPYVDFPLQFNFGSTYASSVTVFFDN